MDINQGFFDFGYDWFRGKPNKSIYELENESTTEVLEENKEKEETEKTEEKDKKIIIKKESSSSYAKRMKKEREALEKKQIEEEEKDPSPRFKCDYPAMSVNGYIELLKSNGYKKSIKKWNIWFPDGYNNIDEKLKNVKPTNDEQIIFTIPGCDNIVSKYNTWKSLEKYYGREIASTIMPESFLLDKKDHIKLIKKLEGEKFILKKKKQRKQGLKITTDIEEIQKGYKNEYLIAQKLIKPFLVNKRKVNLRVYLMVTLHKGELKAYFNNYGSCIYTKDEYDDNSISFETNITSYKMDMDIYNDNPLTFEQLKTYLKDNGYDHDILFNKIKEKMSLFLTAMKEQLGYSRLKNNLCAQVFGLDFIINEDLDPLLLECNKGPEMKPKITTIDDPEEINDDMINMINNLKDLLISDNSDKEKIKNIKKCYTDLYKGYPKTISSDTLLEKIEDFYSEEKELESYPCGYKTGNGRKVQKDSLTVLGIIKDNENNGFEKIL